MSLIRSEKNVSIHQNDDRGFSWLTKLFIILTPFILYAGFSTYSEVKGARVNTTLDRGNSLSNGLVGYWTFEGGDFTDKVYDTSGQGNHGYVVGGATSTVKNIGTSGQGVQLSGAEYIAVPDSSSLSPSTAQTVSFWVMRTDSNSVVRDLVGKSTTGDRGWGIASWSTNAVYFYIADSFGDSGSNYVYTASNALPRNQWTHVTAVFDGSLTGNTNRAKLYFNGVQASTTGVGTIPATLRDSATAIWLGKGGYATALPGMIDEVRVYNRALSEKEIKTLYSAGQTKITQSSTENSEGLVGWWTFDGEDISGTSVIDKSGTKATGTLTNGPIRVAGKTGQALQFDGVDDYIRQSATSSVIAGLTSMTFSAWVKPRTWTGCAGIFSAMEDDTGCNSNINGFQITRDSFYGTNRVRFSIDTTTGNFVTASNSTLPLNEWTHVVVTWDGRVNTSTSTKFYFNGQDVGLDSLWCCGTAYRSGDGRFKIGTNATNVSRFDGIIDDVRIYNRVLSPAEVEGIYAETSGPIIAKNQVNSITDGLVGYWSFNGPDVTDKVYDRSGQNNYGYIVGAATSSVLGIGKIGQALSLDGTDDAVMLTKSPPSAPVTYSAWIYPRNVSEGCGPIIGRLSPYYCGGEYGYGIQVYYGYFVGLATSDDWSRVWATNLRTPAVNNEWQHVVFSLTGMGANQTGKLYVNGILKSTYTGTAGSYPYSPSIGSSANTNNFFTGGIDEVRIYNRVLSDEEVRELYQQGI